MKNIICSIIVGVFPYVPIALLTGGADIEWALWGIVGIFVLAVASCILNMVFALKDKMSAKNMALIAMLVKLIHIPAYILFFMIGAGGILFIHFFAITILLFLFDCITIGFSGMVELAAVLRARSEGTLKNGEALLCGICSFIFCIDVIAAIVIYLCVRKRSGEKC